MANRIRYRVLLFSLVVVALLTSVQPLAVAQNTPHLVVNTYRLNVRSGPGVSHNIIDTVAGGTVLPVISLRVGSDWIQVTSPSGPGWVNSFYAVARGDFTSVPNQFTPPNLGSGTAIPAGAPHVVVNTAYLNVRTGPGIGHSILTTVRGGTALAVTAIQYGGVWYQVETSAGTGWINRTYTVKRGDFSGLAHTGEPADTGPQPSIPAGAPYLVINTAYLNVRTGPGIGHDVLTTVPGGTELLVTAIDGGGVWYQVETSAGTGWVNSNYAVGRGSFAGLSRTGQPSQREGAHLSGSTPRAVVNTAFLNIRSGPGIGNSIVATVPGGTVLRVLGLSRGRGWYQVEGSFGQGWLNNFYTVFRGDFSQVGVVN
ncbi:MAG: SH3 domain-containing protein [Chloroflexi bacterium]|nr:SH3 domain-containing protein [Chloroflexota bacterium]